MDDQRPGDERAAEPPFGKRGDEPEEISRRRPPRLGTKCGAGAFAPARKVAKRPQQHTPSRRILRRDRADVVGDDMRTETVGEFEGPLRPLDPGLEPIAVGVAAPSGEAEGGHHQPLVGEPLPQLPHAGGGDPPAVELGPDIEFHPLHTECPRATEGGAQVGGEGAGRDTDTGSIHGVVPGAERGTGPKTDCMIEAMMSLATVTAALEHLAPLRLAAEWDSVGLLVGSRRERIGRVLTCLTLSAAVVDEAIGGDFDLIVTHHPLPFRPVARLTDATPTGGLLLDLARAGVAVWSSHTAWDSAAGGINDQLAAAAGLSAVAPLIPDSVATLAGFGRMGLAPPGLSVVEFARQLAAHLGAPGTHLAGATDREVGRVGIVCGSGAEGIPIARQAGCDTFVTGELKLHDALHAANLGMQAVVLGHHASERFSMPVLADRLAALVPGLECRASDAERDPLIPLCSL